MKKLTFCLRRRPEMSCEEFQFYWREQHAPLVLARAKVLGIRRYVQVRTERNDKLHERLQMRNGGSPAAFDGIAELWYDDDWPLGVRSDEARRAAAELLEDERNFIDLENSPMSMGLELSVLGLSSDGSEAKFLAPRSELHGLWRLSKWAVIYDDGRPARFPFGADATGQLLYAEEGQMSVTVVSGTRAKLREGSIRKASLVQKAAAFESIFHYAGSYEIQDSEVVHHVSVSSNPNLTGTRQVRSITLSENTLVIAPLNDERESSGGRHRLTWRRAK